MIKRVILLSILSLVYFSTITNAEMIDDAIGWMYNNHYTKYSTREAFRPTRLMRRDEAAKFFVIFAQSLGKKEIKSDQECQFSDLDEGHSDLKAMIIESCKLGIFKGYQDRFMPKDNLTNAQTLALTLRILSGYEDEKNVDYRADNYYHKANTRLWFMRFGEFYDKEGYTSRWLLAEVLYHLHLGKIVTHEPVSILLTGERAFQSNSIYTGIVLTQVIKNNQDLKDFSSLRLAPQQEAWSKSFDIIDIENHTKISVDLPGARSTAGFIARSPIYIGQQFNSSGYTYIGATRSVYNLPHIDDYRLFQISYTGEVKQIAYLPFGTRTSDFYYLPDRNIIYYEKSGDGQAYQYNINSGLLERISQEILRQYQQKTQETQKALDPTFEYLTKDKKECSGFEGNCVLWIQGKYYDSKPTDLFSSYRIYPLGNKIYLLDYRARQSIDDGRNIYRGIIDSSFFNTLQ